MRAAAADDLAYIIQQDPLFKDVFYRQVLQQWRAERRTALVIQRGDRYFHLADRLIRFEDGKHHP